MKLFGKSNSIFGSTNIAELMRLNSAYISPNRNPQHLYIPNIMFQCYLCLYDKSYKALNVKKYWNVVFELSLQTQ